MKKFFLTLAFIATLSTTAVSCSTDDSAITETNADANLNYETIDNGNKELPKPPQKP